MSLLMNYFRFFYNVTLEKNILNFNKYLNNPQLKIYLQYVKCINKCINKNLLEKKNSS